MTSIEVLRRLPRGSRYAIAERVEFIAEEQWTLEFVTAAINEILLDDARAVTVAESLLAEHPEAPLRIVDGQVIRPQIGSVLHALETVRTVEVLEPEPLGDVPGIPLPDLASVARMLDVTAAELDWFADHGQWLRHSSMPLRHYRVRRIAKPAGGVRVIEAPKPRLAEAQRRILRRVLDPVGTHPAARGFRRGGSVLAYASPHVGASSVVRLDLRDCFSTVTASRVRAAFRRRAGAGAGREVHAIRRRSRVLRSTRSLAVGRCGPEDRDVRGVLGEPVEDPSDACGIAAGAGGSSGQRTRAGTASGIRRPAGAAAQRREGRRRPSEPGRPRGLPCLRLRTDRVGGAGEYFPTGTPPRHGSSGAVVRAVA